MIHTKEYRECNIWIDKDLRINGEYRVREQVVSERYIRLQR